MQYGKDNLNPFSGLAIKFQTHVLTGQKISFLYILKPLNNLKQQKVKNYNSIEICILKNVVRFNYDFY